MTSKDSVHFNHKIIPDLILEEANIALSHYPELANTPIEFKLKKSLNQSVMKAQPKFSSLLSSKKNREYIILISKNFTIDKKELHLKDIPKDVLIGWLGHELGHIMDYMHRSSLNLIWFGIKYSISGKHIKEAERAADSYAVQHKMKDYILKTKNFILNHSELSDKYKERIKRLYLSPAEILTIVEESEN